MSDLRREWAENILAQSEEAAIHLANVFFLDDHDDDDSKYPQMYMAVFADAVARMSKVSKRIKGDDELAAEFISHMMHSPDVFLVTLSLITAGGYYLASRATHEQTQKMIDLIVSIAHQEGDDDEQDDD